MNNPTPRSIAEALRELAAELRDVAVTWADDMPSRAYADFRAIADRLETQALATANGAEGLPEHIDALLTRLERYSDGGSHPCIAGPSAGDAYQIAQDLRRAYAERCSRDGLPEYVLALLIAGGWVTQAKVDEARKIALGIVPGPLATQPQAASDGEDARRYRWLRNGEGDVAGLFSGIDYGETGEPYGYLCELHTGATLDAAIDAAMTTDAAKGEGK